MAGIDPSIPLSITPPNPLQMMGQMATTMGTLAEAQTRIRALKAQQAIGQIIQHDTDPTGNVNWLQVQADASGNPDAAYGMNALTESSLARQTGLQTLAAARRTALVNAVGTLPKDATAQDVVSMVGGLTQQGVIDPQTGAATLGSLPSDPAQIQPYLRKQFFLPSLGPTGAETANYGTITNIDTGGKIQPTIQNPVTATSQPVPGGVIEKTQSPEALGTMVPYVDPVTGVSGVIPKGAVETPQGGAKVVAGITGAQGQLPTSLPPGVVEARTAPVQVSGQQLAGLETSVNGTNGLNGSAARVLTLKKALTGLQGAKTGPGTNEVNNIKSFLLAMSPDWLKGVLGITPEKVQDIKSYDEANKYLTQVALAQSGSFGPSTDAKLASAITGNASTHISNLAAQDVVKVSIAMERAQQAELDAFKRTGLPAEQFSDFASKWNQNVDPRAFLYGEQTPKERKAMIDAMPAADKKRYFNSLRSAINAGIPGIAEDFQR